jgi:hypothetical protein
MFIDRPEKEGLILVIRMSGFAAAQSSLRGN